MPFGGLLPYHSVGGASAVIEPFARVRPEELPCPQLPLCRDGERRDTFHSRFLLRRCGGPRSPRMLC